MIKTLKTYIGEAQEGNATLIFSDASHMLHTTHIGYAIQRKWRQYTKQLDSNTWRDRLTILWALNPISHELIEVTTSGMCNTDLWKELLKKIAQTYRWETDRWKMDQSIPLYYVLDNARYQKSVTFQEYARTLWIILVYLPPYCPHLNVIEMFWKWLKKKLRNKYFPSFQEFSQAVLTILWSLQEYDTELQSLLSLNFRVI